MKNNRAGACLLSLVLLVGLAGCGGSGPAPINYYLIDPVSQPPVIEMAKFNVQILELDVPQYLSRFQIASRAGSNRLTFSDDHQWGENLRKNLLRTMARNLSELLRTADVGTPITRLASEPEFRLQVFIEQFDQSATGEIVLAGRYQVTDGKSGDVLLTRGYEYQGDTIAEGDYARLVASMQILFGVLSRDVANQLVELHGS